MYAADAACPITAKAVAGDDQIGTARAPRLARFETSHGCPSVQRNRIRVTRRLEDREGAVVRRQRLVEPAPLGPAVVARWNSIFAAKRLSASRSASTSTCNAAGTSPPRYRVPDNVSIACAASSPRPARRADSIACSRSRADSSIVVTHRASSPSTRSNTESGILRACFVVEHAAQHVEASRVGPGTLHQRDGRPLVHRLDPRMCNVLERCASQ